jgi:putative two-component system response regulator
LTARILVVDDEEQARNLLCRILSEAGYDCVMAQSAVEALAVLEAGPIELLLTDVNMPGSSGFELLGTVRDRFPDTGALIISALDDAKLVDLAVELGTYGYILKPFQRNELLIAILNAVRRRDLEVRERARRQHLEREVKARTELLERRTRATPLRTAKPLKLDGADATPRCRVRGWASTPPRPWWSRWAARWA